MGFTIDDALNELYYFRIDHDKLYFIRICLVQDTDDKCIDTYPEICG